MALQISHSNFSRKRRVRAAAILSTVFCGLVFSTYPATAPQAAPSFDCTKAKQPVERAICDDQELSKADSELAEKYSALMGMLDEFKRPWFRNWQRSWMKERSKCIDDLKPESSTLSCLFKLYRTRITSIDNNLTHGPDREMPGDSELPLCEQFRDQMALTKSESLTAPKTFANLEKGGEKFHLIHPTTDPISLIVEMLSRRKVPKEEIIEIQETLENANDHFAYDIDIDGNGITDLVLENVAGTLACHRYNFFLAAADGTLRSTKSPNFDGFTDEGALCEDSNVDLAFVRMPDEHISIVVRNNALDLDMFYFFRIQPNGAIQNQCRVIFGVPNGKIYIDHKRP